MDLDQEILLHTVKLAVDSVCAFFSCSFAVPGEEVQKPTPKISATESTRRKTPKCLSGCQGKGLFENHYTQKFDLHRILVEGTNRGAAVGKEELAGESAGYSRGINQDLHFVVHCHPGGPEHPLQWCITFHD